MSYWNYRVVEKVLSKHEHDTTYDTTYDTTSYEVHEVYYDEDGNITMWSEDSIIPYGEGCLKDLEVDIKFMLEACSKPILKESELPNNGEYFDKLLKENGL